MRRIAEFSPACGRQRWCRALACAACGLVGLGLAWWRGLEAGTGPVPAASGTQSTAGPPESLAPPRAERQPRATLADGSAARGRLVGSRPREIRWQADDGREWRVAELRRIDFPPAAVPPPAEGPPRQMGLRGGDRVTGVLIGLDEQQATFVLRGAGRVSVPRSAVAEIAALAGLRDRLYEDFEEDELVFRSRTAGLPAGRLVDGDHSQALALGGSMRLEHVLDAPIEEGRVQFRFRHVAEDRGGRPHRSGLELWFAAQADRASVRIVLSGAGRPAAIEAPRELRLTTQALPPRDGWRRLAVVIRGGRTLVLLDEHLLAAGRAPRGELAALSLFCEPVDGGRAAAAPVGAGDALPDPAVLIDDVLVQEYVARAASGPPRAGQDVIESFGGDRLFGAVTRADRRGVELSGVFGRVRRAWPEVARIVLERSPEPGTSSASGWWCRVTLPPPADHPGGPEDTLELAIQAVDEDRLLARHPVLGELRLGLDEIRRIEPRFLGTRLTLRAGVAHLGDEVRSEFRRPVPEGHVLSGEFALDEVPPGRAFFTVDVADLEPSGPDAPLGSPFLAELRAGFLRTDAFVNGQRLGSLNDRLRWRPPIDDPQRVRVPVPAGLLRQGRNVWRIEQRPARDNPHEFDDAEFGPIAIEFDEGL